MIDRKQIEKRLQDLRESQEALQNQLHGYAAAIGECERWLDLLSQAKPNLKVAEAKGKK